MKWKKTNKSEKYLRLKNFDFSHPKNKKQNYKKSFYFIIVLFSFLFLFLLIYNLFKKEVPSITPIKPKENEKEKEEKKIYFDQYEVYKFNEIKESVENKSCSSMWANQREFLNGLVRKFKPKKIVEVGTSFGGSAIIILNAIDDLKDSKLYSIDLDKGNHVGKCVHKYFQNLMRKWTLFTGNIAAAFLEEIGGDIDMAFFDTSHQEPGEIMDFLMVLPFLKENAIVAFHDIAIQITHSPERNEWAPYIIFNGIRGEKYLPSGDDILKQNIGAAILDTNQKKYYQEYFRLLGGQWQYLPKEEHVIQLRNFFKKYYEKDCKECLIIFEEAISFNRDFVKRNPKEIFYRYTSD